MKQAANRGYGWLGPAILREATVDAIAELVTHSAGVVGRSEGGTVGSITAHLHLAVAGAMAADRMLGTEGKLTDAAMTVRFPRFPGDLFIWLRRGSVGC